MSEIRLVVREATRDWSGTLHASSVDRAIAALSADPVTLEELETAMGRYERGSRLAAQLQQGTDDEPHDAGIVWIDLAARVVAVESTWSSPGPDGDVPYHDGKAATDTWLPYLLADDWLFSSSVPEGRGRAAERRAESALLDPLDVRAVLYGRPLFEYAARELLLAFGRREELFVAARARLPERERESCYVTPRTPEQEAGQLEAEVIRQIHAAWLLTPRDDLRGLCPRAAAMAQARHVAMDVQFQSTRWSFVGTAPPAVHESSWAYRYGSFGTHELIQYYHLLRETLWSCWDRLKGLEQGDSLAARPGNLLPSDFLTTEVPRLEQVAGDWLDAPAPECHGRTPRMIIDRERQRLPMPMSAHEAIVDPDCPCCQSMAEMPGPVFWCLDGYGLDEEFAFDTSHRTREEYDEHEREMEEMHAQFDAQREEERRLGVDYAAQSQAPWTQSFVVEGVDLPLGVRVFQVGCRLAEVLSRLRTSAAMTEAETRPWIDQLNRDFGNLREVLLAPEDPSLAAALVEPVREKFQETLAALAEARADLARHCEALAGDLERLLAPEELEASDYPEAPEDSEPQ